MLTIQKNVQLDSEGVQVEPEYAFGSKVAKGCWRQGLTDDIVEKKAILERLDYGVGLIRPKVGK